MDRYSRSLLLPGALSSQLIGFEGYGVLEVLKGFPSRFGPPNPADENLIAPTEGSIAKDFLNSIFPSHKVYGSVVRGDSRWFGIRKIL